MYVPKFTRVNDNRSSFIDNVSRVSKSLFKNQKKIAIAPMGGAKITPFLELDLNELVIVTDSYPGTPLEIRTQFENGSLKLQKALEQAFSKGSMSTEEVLEVNIASQIIARLKLELDVKEVKVSYWSENPKMWNLGVKAWADRKMKPKDTPIATFFEFKHKNEDKRIVLISAYIQPDSAGNLAGFPELLKDFIPREGFHWAYLSADGLGFFSQNPKNGLQTANDQLIDSLKSNGAILLDYPTDNLYHTPQIEGDMRFMEGRRNLESPFIKLVKTIRVEKPGVFGYCLQKGDEVRVYQKISSSRLVERSNLPSMKRVGEVTTWTFR